MTCHAKQYKDKQVVVRQPQSSNNPFDGLDQSLIFTPDQQTGLRAMQVLNTRQVLEKSRGVTGVVGIVDQSFGTISIVPKEAIKGSKIKMMITADKIKQEIVDGSFYQRWKRRFSRKKPNSDTESIGSVSTVQSWLEDQETVKSE